MCREILRSQNVARPKVMCFGKMDLTRIFPMQNTTPNEHLSNRVSSVNNGSIIL